MHARMRPKRPGYNDYHYYQYREFDVYYFTLSSQDVLECASQR